MSLYHASRKDRKKKKTVGGWVERERERQRDRETDRQTDRQREREKDREADRHRQRDTERLTETERPGTNRDDDVDSSKPCRDTKQTSHTSRSYSVSVARITLTVGAVRCWGNFSTYRLHAVRP